MMVIIILVIMQLIIVKNAPQITNVLNVLMILLEKIKIMKSVFLLVI